MRAWFCAIAKQMEGMSREQKMDHIRRYYWYHILIALAVLGLAVLLIRHIFFPRPRVLFQCAVVNQPIDYPRDGRISEECVVALGLKKGQAIFDSDYQISYGDVQLEGTNESSYEKFFFNIAAGVLDAVTMPESFYTYAVELGVAFAQTEEIGLQTMEKLGLVAQKTSEDEAGPLLYGIVADSGHGELAEAFAEYARIC